MRVLHVINAAPPHGGAAIIAYNQAKYLTAEVSIISFESGFNDLNHCQVIELRGLKVGGDWLLRPLEYIKLWKLIKIQDTVLLHSQYFFINQIAAVFAGIQGKKIICFYTGKLPSPWRNRWQSRFINFWCQRWLVLDSAHTALLTEWVGNLKPVSLVQNGLEYKKLRKISRPGKAVPCKKFIYAGHLTVDKGMAELLTAARFLPGVQFVIIGEGPFRDQLRALPNVEVLGYLPHDQLLEHILKADCLIHPSHHETFSLTVMEAITLGVPVITPPLTSLLKKVVPENGILIEAKNSQSLIRALQRAMLHGIAVSHPEMLAELDWTKSIHTLEEALTQ